MVISSSSFSFRIVKTSRNVSNHKMTGLMGVCNLCYTFCNCLQPQCSIIELAFSKAEIRSFSKVNGMLNATWDTSLLDILLVNRVISHSSICKTIIIIIIYTVPRVCTSVLSLI